VAREEMKLSEFPSPSPWVMEKTLYELTVELEELKRRVKALEEKK
jgi:hypothetical protein